MPKKSILVAHNNYLLGLEHLNQIPSYSRTTNNTDDVLRQFDTLDSKYVIKKRTNSKQATTSLKTTDEPSLTYDLSVFDSMPQKTSEVSSSDSIDKHLWPTERFDVPNTVVRERTIKLPETHIFTPIKSISPVAREVSRESSPIDHEKEKKPTVIKEYHDIEYSLEPSTTTTKKIADSNVEFGDFNDFQSATSPIPNNSGILMPTAVNLAPTILEPQKVIVTYDCDSLTSLPSQNSEIQQSSTKYDVFNDLSKPESNIEDDFADFQAAPPTIVPVKVTPQIIEKQKFYREDSITLSPSRLVSNLQKMPDSHQQPAFTSWMNDTLDSDEISRIEAAFPKCKVDNSKKKQQQVTVDVKEDDEWCDFQCVSQTSSNVINSLVPNQSSSLAPFDTKKSSDINADTSDWSDFVSVPIVKPSINTSQFLSKPNFSSWNQSVGKPFVNHTTSFLSSNNNYPNSHFEDAFYPSMSDGGKTNKSVSHRQTNNMNITNNFNYNNFDRQETKAPPYQMSNGISTILPDLQFALPKNCVNLSRGNGPDNTKK